MKNNLIISSLIIVVFVVILVAENSVLFLGVEKGVLFSLIIFLFAIKKSYINSYPTAFLYGLLGDSLNSFLPFGIYSLLFILYFTLIKHYKNKSISEVLVFLIYFVNFIILSLLLNSLTAISFINTIIFYFVFRIFYLFLFKQ